MRKLFKTSFIALSALVLPFTASLVTRAEGTTYADDIDTKLEYQISSDGSDIRYISTMELKNDRTLNDITSIQMEFIITDGIVDRSRIETTTTVYDKITGTKDRVENTYYAVFKITDLTDKYSGWRISSNFTYYFADSTSETVESSSWLIGVAHKSFVQQYTDWGTDMYAYLYGANGDNQWPGQKMTLVDAEKHIYEFSYLLGEEYTTVIFNNNSTETASMPLSNDYDYYVQQDGNAYAHPTAGHNFIPTDNNVHTCSICGHVENHSFVTTGENEVTCSICGGYGTYDANTVYCVNSLNWDTIKIHYWGGTKASDWPGENMEPCGKNQYNQDIYKFTLPEGTTGILFNNGNGTQSVNITDFTNNAYFLNYEWIDGKCTYGTYIYIEEIITE